MAHFCYYVPDRQVVTEGDLKSLHLEHALEGRFACTRRQGPDGKQGAMLCGEGNEVPPTESLTWFPPPTDDMGHPIVWWIGVPAEMPTPDELKRDVFLDGDYCTLGDGNQWLVPHVRCIHGLSEDGIKYACQLPTRWQRDLATGNAGNYVIEKYRELWAASKVAVELCIERPLIDREGHVSHAFSTQESHDLSALALSVNYRIGFWEIMTLGLPTDGTFGDLVRALADSNAFVEWLDNQEAAPVPPFPLGEEPDSPDGGADLTPDTPLPEESSPDSST